jgi:hypothetical protein
MRQSSPASLSSSPLTLRARVRAAIAVVALFAGSGSGVALPPVNGSNCGSNWVNNQGALECFIQGENETNGGSSNPHYVGCSADGEIFCCFDNPKTGGQVCESVGTAEHADVQQQVRAILQAQAAISAGMARLSKRLDDLENKLSDQNRKN